MLPVFLTAAAILAIYILRTNPVAGMVVDDAWYVMLAKSLSSGDGYRLINSPTTPILPLYPPGFPAILSVMFRLAPDFPQNVWILKSVSIAAMGGTGFLTYAYLHRDRLLPRQIAACAALAVTMTPGFVFLATSTIMSECVFTFIQLAAVLVMHRSVEDRTGLQGAVLTGAGGLLAAAAMLTRSAGISVLLAGALWLAKERLWRRAGIFCAVALLTMAPWMLYARAHRASDAARASHGGFMVYAYSEQFWMRWAGSPGSGQTVIQELPARLANGLVDVFGRSVAGIVMPMLFRDVNESGEEVVSLGGAAGISAASMGSARAPIVISFAFAGFMLVGFVQTARRRLTMAEILVPISLSITLLWPFWSYRFVLPLAPYLLLYFVLGLQRLNALAATRTAWTLPPWQLARVTLLCVLGLHAYDHLGYILHVRDRTQPHASEWVASGLEADAVLSWMSGNLVDEGIVATTNPALVYLRTGRRTVALDTMTDEWKVWKARGVRYVACLRPLDLPRESLGKYTVLYRTPGRLWVIEI